MQQRGSSNIFEFLICCSRNVYDTICGVPRGVHFVGVMQFIGELRFDGGGAMASFREWRYVVVSTRGRGYHPSCLFVLSVRPIHLSFICITPYLFIMHISISLNFFNTQLNMNIDCNYYHHRYHHYCNIQLIFNFSAICGQISKVTISGITQYIQLVFSITCFSILVRFVNKFQNKNVGMCFRFESDSWTYFKNDVFQFR